MTAADVCAAILTTWPANHDNRPRYVTAFEVNNGAGFSYTRTLDAVVIDTWPYKGFTISGYEVKVSSGDMRRELQDTTKFQGFANLLDYYSIAAPPGIVKLAMLPANWGLYEVQKDGTLRAKRKPLMLHDGSDMKTTTRSFMVAFTRSLVTRSLSREAERAARAEGFREGEASTKYDLARLQREKERFEKVFAEFQEASGLDLRHAYSGVELGEAVKLVMKGGLRRQMCSVRDLHRLAAETEQLATEFDRLAEMMTPEMGKP